MSPRRALARHKAAPATCERQQNASTGEIQTHATLHAPENASSFFNEASTIANADSVKDKDSLPKSGPALNGPPVSVLIPRGADDLQNRVVSRSGFRNRTRAFKGKQWKAKPDSYFQS
jgi:hypothetical protein